MTYGNMSWHEYGQIGLDQARDSLERQMKETVDFEQRQNKTLKEKAKNAEEISQILKLRAEKAEQATQVAQQEVESYKQLLASPLHEIAKANGSFKQTYDAQQQLLAEWIMGQKAFKETAMQLGIQVGKTPEEIQQIATQNANAVLENRTEHGNNSTTSPLLAEHAATILAIRKKNGKA